MKAQDLRGNKVLIIGTGISGIGSAKLLGKAGAVPVILDENTKVYEREVRTKLEGYSGEKPEITEGKALLMRSRRHHLIRY